MRNVVWLICLLLLPVFTQHSHAQLPGPGNIDWVEVWTLYQPSSPDAGVPNYWMYGNRSYTGLAYDMWNDVVYVVNPGSCGTAPNQTDCMRIWALDADDGVLATRIDPPNAPAGQLYVDPGVVSGGFGEGKFSLFRIDLDDQGRIYAANAVAPLWGSCYPGPPPQCDPAYLNQGPYKIYRWDSPTSTPQLIYQTPANGMTPAIWGTSFNVVGKEHQVNGRTVDSTRVFASGGKFYPGYPSYSNNEINCFVADTSTNAPTPFRLALRLIDDTPESGFAAHGIAATGPWPNSPIITNANYHQIEFQEQVQTNAPFPQTYQLTGPIDSIPNAVGGPTGAVKFFRDRRYKLPFLLAVDGVPSSQNLGDPNYNTTARCIYLGGKPYVMYPPTPTPPIDTNRFNSFVGLENYITDIDCKIWINNIPGDVHQGDPYLQLFVLLSNNGIACFRTREPITWPVELQSFTASIVDRSVLLSWLTASETNNHGFEVQRSLNRGSDWEKIGFVDGHGTTTAAQEYSFEDPVTDIHRNTGKVAYRLKQIDFDGSNEYSPIVDVLTGISPSGIALTQNYPNPSGGTTEFAYSVPEAGPVSLKIYNALGLLVATVHEGQTERGTHTETYDCSSLPKGVYVYRLSTTSGSIERTMIIAR